jgi:trehalose 6-phosphate synthase
MMREYDALLVNPLIDGMNLVVKEAALVNERAGAVILSRTAGAYEQIGPYVLGVPPTDTQAIASALFEALTAPRRQRQERATALVNTLMRESAPRWLQAQVRDLAAQTARPQVTLETPSASGRGWLVERDARDEPALTTKSPLDAPRDTHINIS